VVLVVRVCASPTGSVVRGSTQQTNWLDVAKRGRCDKAQDGEVVHDRPERGPSVCCAARDDVCVLVGVNRATGTQRCEGDVLRRRRQRGRVQHRRTNHAAHTRSLQIRTKKAFSMLLLDNDTCREAEQNEHLCAVRVKSEHDRQVSEQGTHARQSRNLQLT
jgi:hypothetical protein